MAFTTQGNTEHWREMTPGKSETAGVEEHTMRSPWDYKRGRHQIKAAADSKTMTKFSWVTSAKGEWVVGLGACVFLTEKSSFQLL